MSLISTWSLTLGGGCADTWRGGWISLELEVGMYEKIKRSPPSLSGVDEPSPLAQLWSGTLNHWVGNGCGRGKRNVTF